jgi:hypothetical protein
LKPLSGGISRVRPPQSHIEPCSGPRFSRAGMCLYPD